MPAGMDQLKERGWPNLPLPEAVKLPPAAVVGENKFWLPGVPATPLAPLLPLELPELEAEELEIPTTPLIGKP